MLEHIKTVGLLMIILGVVGAVIAIGSLIAFGGFAGIMGNSDYGRPGTLASTPVWGLFTGFLTVFSILMAPLLIVGGIGLRQYKPWARSMSIIVCALNILSVPVGSIIGCYGLWALLSPESEPIFDEGLGRGPMAVRRAPPRQSRPK